MLYALNNSFSDAINIAMFFLKKSSDIDNGKFACKERWKNCRRHIFYAVHAAASRVKKWEITRKKGGLFFSVDKSWKLAVMLITNCRYQNPFQCVHFEEALQDIDLNVCELKNIFGSFLKVIKIFSLNLKLFSPSHIVLLSFCLKTAVNIWFIHFPILKLSFSFFH